jgi:DeoR/GlpR family transcriptional regulator of sugar metabolism
MLARQRQSAIVDLIRRRGGARVGDLAGRFGVSDMTIRRNLAALAERGLVEKVPTAALAAPPTAPGR